ncbi:GntR family transcriptional regulator [Allosphingosinicella vermicomposti]|uniref:GntR family transcriptional regulator n=1 Tax=Allosphingosinicella vermicomposti TaxID=614671 RepID=UPI000D10AB69|nr:GntR family transcriptional regulator [Allosphingosinicella vermicomposti]
MVSTAQGNDRFSRVYVDIRKQVVTGRFLPGAQIKVAEAAAHLKLSTTPVREALSRLVGEGLLEDRRRHGFFVPVPSPYDLIDLYTLMDLFLGAAWKKPDHGSRPFIPPFAGDNADEPVGADPARDLFSGILRRSNNFALIETGERALDRLASARRAEPLVLGCCDEELGLLREALNRGDRDPLFALVRSYHRRRKAHAPQLSYVIANRSAAAEEYIQNIV